MKPQNNNNLLARLWFWLTYDITRVKSWLIMGVLAALAWGLFIYRDYTVEGLEGSNEFVRWDFWVGIAGTLGAWAFVIYLGRASRRRKSRDSLKG